VQDAILDGPDPPAGAVEALHRRLGHQQRLFQRRDLDQHLGLLAEMEPVGARLALDVDPAFLADPVVLDADAHDTGQKALLRQ
jgi:hypothetical protein